MNLLIVENGEMSIQYVQQHLCELSGSGKRKKLRTWIWHQQNMRCFWCGRSMVLPITRKDRRSNMMPTVDHLTPACRGGKLKLSNLVVACALCNRDRDTKSAKKTIHWLSRRKQWKT